MTIKSVDRYLVHEVPPMSWRSFDFSVLDRETEDYIAHCPTRAHAEHIAHCLNAFNHLIASVEALP